MAAAVVHYKFASEPAFKQAQLPPGSTQISVPELRQLLLGQRQARKEMMGVHVACCITSSVHCMATSDGLLTTIRLVNLLCAEQELQAAFAPGSHYGDGTWRIVFLDVDKKLGAFSFVCLKLTLPRKAAANPPPQPSSTDTCAAPLQTMMRTGMLSPPAQRWLLAWRRYEPIPTRPVPSSTGSALRHTSTAFFDRFKSCPYTGSRTPTFPSTLPVISFLKQDKPVVAPTVPPKNVIGKFNLGLPGGLKDSPCELQRAENGLKLNIASTSYTGVSEQLVRPPPEQPPLSLAQHILVALIPQRGASSLTSCCPPPHTPQPAPYFLLRGRADGNIEAVPVGPLFSFRPDPKPRFALSLEEAEAQMKSRRARVFNPALCQPQPRRRNVAEPKATTSHAPPRPAGPSSRRPARSTRRRRRRRTAPRAARRARGRRAA